MRSLLLIVVFATSTALGAGTFPPPISQERPASAPAFGAAAGSQQTLAAASNGQMSFAVWFDQRSGATDLYGSRIDSSGVPLDPLGILIVTGATGGDVFWNGTAFVVIAEKGQQTTFTFVTPDGAIADRKSKQIVNQLTATMGTGSDTRVLFVGNGTAMLLDSQANIVSLGANLTFSFLEMTLVAASSGSEFLIIHTMPGTDRPLYADRGRHFAGRDRQVCRRNPDPRGLPGAPGDRPGLRRHGDQGCARHARQVPRHSRHGAHSGPDRAHSCTCRRT